MSLNPVNISIMPSESSFKKHAEVTHEALKTFTMVHLLKSLVLIKTAIFDPIDAIITVYPFIPFFLTHNLFQEISTSAFNVLSSFAKENSSFIMPKTMDKVTAINDCIQGSLTSKKGLFLLLFISFYFCLCFHKQNLLLLPLMPALKPRRF